MPFKFPGFPEAGFLMGRVIGAMLECNPAVSIVGEAADGMEAIYMAAVLRPDGIIMDINMPKINGIEATKQIKAAQPMIRIIGLSVIDDEHVRQAMKTAGAEGVLLKDEIHQHLVEWSRIVEGR